MPVAAEPVSEVKVSSNVAEAVETNTTVVLTCAAKGSFLTFTWTNGTTPLLPDNKRITLKEVSPAPGASCLITSLIGSGPEGAGPASVDCWRCRRSGPAP